MCQVNKFLSACSDEILMYGLKSLELKLRWAQFAIEKTLTCGELLKFRMQKRFELLQDIQNIKTEIARRAAEDAEAQTTLYMLHDMGLNATIAKHHIYL